MQYSSSMTRNNEKTQKRIEIFYNLNMPRVFIFLPPSFDTD